MKYEIATESATIAGFSGTTPTSALDVSGALEVIIAYSGGSDVPAITECDTSGGSFTAVASTDLVSGDDVIGYKGYKQFIKVTGVASQVGAVVKIGCKHCPTG